MKLGQKAKEFWNAFLADESGQTTTEYVLLIVVVVIAIRSIGSKMSTRLGGLIDKVFNSADTQAEQLGN